MIMLLKMSDEDNRTTAFHRLLHDARRRMGISQSSLAKETGCSQSAISMMEKGRVDALSIEKLNRIAERLGVPVPEEKSRSSTAWPAAGFCPECECPSNKPYLVGDNVLWRPSIREVSLSRGVYCQDCGEVLETTCPNCNRAIQDGACCPYCGNAYVIASEEQTTRVRRQQMVGDRDAR